MNKYKDKSKQQKLLNIMQNRRSITYKDIKQMQQDGIFEDYDLIKIESDHFKDMFMFYYNSKYMMITRSKDKIKLIDEELLEDRKFLLSRSFTNGVQNFLQTKGREQFEKLNKKALIEAILNQSDRLMISQVELEER